MYDISFFEDELSLIEDTKIRLLTRTALERAPAWFWTAPSSSSGKYHPVDSNGDGGTCRHVKKVVWFAVGLARAHMRDTDIHRSAGLTHDITKFGLDDEMETGKDRPQYKRHGEIAAHWLKELQIEAMPELDQYGFHKWSTICLCVKSHMGRWGETPPVTLDQQITHFADLAAADKHFVALPFYDPANWTPLDPVADATSYRMKTVAGNVIIDFGKHAGMTVQDLVAKEREYAEWILGADFDYDVKKIIQSAIDKYDQGRPGQYGDNGSFAGELQLFG